jgi:hypothetical protein
MDKVPLTLEKYKKTGVITENIFLTIKQLQNINIDE